MIPGLQEYAQFHVSEGMSGFGSVLESAGLIPGSDEERAQMIQNIRQKKSL